MKALLECGYIQMECSHTGSLNPLFCHKVLSLTDSNFKFPESQDMRLASLNSSKEAHV